MTGRAGEGEDLPRRSSDQAAPLWSEEEITLLDLVNRTIDRGIVLHAEAVISVAGIDLVELLVDLRLKAVEGRLLGEGARERGSGGGG